MADQAGTRMGEETLIAAIIATLALILAGISLVVAVKTSDEVQKLAGELHRTPADINVYETRTTPAIAYSAMSLTSAIVSIILIIAITAVINTFLHVITEDERVPWRCRLLGGHKFIDARLDYVQANCLRCGYARKR